MTDDLLALMPFAAHLGIVIESASADEVVATLDWRPELCTAGGILHGGTVMALADSAGAVCAYLCLPEDTTTTTTSSTTQMLRAAGEGTLRATATPLHRGRSAIVVVTDLTDARGKLVARTTQNQAVLAAR